MHKRAIVTGLQGGKADLKSVVRLLDLDEAAHYLGVSYWTMRDYVHGGIIPKVELPHPRDPDGRVLRRILIDRNDLDEFIEKNKEKCA